MKNDPAQILIIHVGSGAKSALDGMLGKAFVAGQHYTFSNMFYGDPAQEKIFFTDGQPQLIIASHLTGVMNAYEVAQRIKKINPSAVVFALTWAVEFCEQDTSLDGIISKWEMRQGFLAELLEAFLAEKSREELASMVKNCARSSFAV